MSISAPRCPDCNSPRWAPHDTDCPKYKRPANEMPKLARIIPTADQRREMAAYIDQKQPGLLDDLGIPREIDE